MVRFLQLNVNGLRGKFRKLHKLVLDYNVSVVVVNELKTSSFYDYERTDFEQLVGYTVYLESARCAVYVRNDLKKRTKQHVVGVDKKAEESRCPEDFFHCCAVSVADENTEQKLLVVSCYRSPRATSENTTDVLEAVAQVPGEFTHLLVAGDFNVHHVRLGSEKTDAAGQRLLDFLDSSTWHVLNNGTPTRGEAVLDLTLADVGTVGCVSKWKVLACPGLSDHNAVTFHFEFPSEGGQQQQERTRWRLRASDEDWEYYGAFASDFVRYEANRSAEGNANRVTDAVKQAAELALGRHQLRKTTPVVEREARAAQKGEAPASTEAHEAL